MTDPVIQYPRARVELRSVVLGEEVATAIVPARVTITRRSHNQAGTCDIEVHGSALPFEPRTLEDLFIAVHFGDAGSMDGAVDEDRFLRFLGYADTVEPTKSDKAPTVKIACRDLSSLLRDEKHLPPDAFPRYSDTLGGAIQRVVSRVLTRATPGAPVGAGQRDELLTVRPGPDVDRPLGPLVSARAQAHPIPVKNDATAWEILEHAAALVSCQLFVDLDEIVVVRGSEEDAGLASPAAELVFGSSSGNLLSVAMKKKFQRNRKGVRVVSYDPSLAPGHRQIEADFPPDSQLPPRRRARPVARRGRTRRGGHGHAAAPQPPEREIFNVSGITSRPALLAYAEEVYRRRARQELEATCETPLLTEPLLRLTNRDRVALSISPDVAAGIAGTDDASAVRFLMRRLVVSEAAAHVLVRAARAVLPDRFYVRSVTLDWNAGGKSSVKVEVVNLIHVEPSS